jgi:hypothetical protein
MEVVMVLRILWQRRRPLIAGFVLALVAALAVGRSPAPPSGVAEVRVVFDTPESQLVGDSPKGADSLSWRTSLAAMQIGTAESRARIARELGVPVNEIAITPLAFTAPAVPASLPKAAVKAANLTVEPYALTLQTDDVLPVVHLVAAAPTRVAAARLAEAGIYALQMGAYAVDTPDRQGLRVTPAGPVHAEDVPGASGRMRIAIVFVALCVLWTVALLVGPLLRGIKRTLRETGVVFP